MGTDDKREGQPFQLLLSSKVALKLLEAGWGRGVVYKKNVVGFLDCAPICSAFTEFLVFGHYSWTLSLTGDEIDRDHDRIYALEEFSCPDGRPGLAECQLQNLPSYLLTLLYYFYNHPIPQIELHARLKNRVVEDE